MPSVPEAAKINSPAGAADWHAAGSLCRSATIVQTSPGFCPTLSSMPLVHSGLCTYQSSFDEDSEEHWHHTGLYMPDLRKRHVTNEQTRCRNELGCEVGMRLSALNSKVCRPSHKPKMSLCY